MERPPLFDFNLQYIAKTEDKKKMLLQITTNLQHMTTKKFSP